MKKFHNLISREIALEKHVHAGDARSFKSKVDS